MPVIQSTTYRCDQCGLELELEGSGMMGSGPAGWLHLVQAGTLVDLWLHAWECVRDYAAGKAPAAAG